MTKSRSNRQRVLVSAMALFALASGALLGSPAASASAASPTVISTIAIGSGPKGVAISPDGAFVYAANTASGDVTVIATSTNTVSGSPIPVGSGSGSIAVTHDGAKVYVSVSGTSGGHPIPALTSIDTASRATTSVTFPTIVNHEALALAMDPTSEVLNVATGDSWLFQMSTTTDLGRGTFTPTPGLNPSAMAITPDGQTLYTSQVCEAPACPTVPGSLLVGTPGLNWRGASSGVLEVVLPIASHPADIVIAPDGRRGYVALSGTNQVAVFDTDPSSPTVNTVLTTIAVGHGPTGIAVSPDGAHVYVTNLDDDTVSVIDTATNTVTATVAVGDQPYAVAVTPDGTTAYVTNYGSNTVSVLSLLSPSFSPDAPTAPMQSFAVPADTTAAQCADLAQATTTAAGPAWIDWGALGSMTALNWGVSWQQWPNDNTGGFVCERQPYWHGSGWSVR